MRVDVCFDTGNGSGLPSCVQLRVASVDFEHVAHPAGLLSRRQLVDRCQSPGGAAMLLIRPRHLGMGPGSRWALP